MNWTLGNRHVHSPLLKLVVLFMLMVMLPLSLPAHIAKWLIDGRGFLTTRYNLYGRRWSYDPPWWGGYNLYGRRWSYDPPWWGVVSGALLVLALVVLL